MAFASSCDREAPAVESIRPVRTVTIGGLAEFQGRQFPGRAEAVQRADLSFRVSGTLMLLPTRVGVVVQKGEVIARLDPRDFEVRVRGGEAALARAAADLARAQEEFTRASVAFERQVVSEMEMVKIREAQNVAKATVDAIEADLQAARDALDDTFLRAPFDGEVAARYVENFEDVQSRQPVLRLLDDRQLHFTVHVPESMIPQLPDVEEILCEFDTFPGRLISAKVDEVGRDADAITRTFPVTLILDQPEGVRILSGMSGRAWVTRMRRPANAPDEFNVPPSAIIEGAGGERYVWTVDPGTGLVSRRTVKTGAISPDGVRVEGLQIGDIVATAGAAFLRDGQRVRMISAVDAMGGSDE